MTTPPLDLTALRDIASAATPGPWEAYDSNEGMDRAYSPMWCVANEEFHNPTTGDDEDWMGVEIHVGDKADSDHIAAFDPETVLALIARAEDAEAAVARAREHHAKVEWRPGTPRPDHSERGVCEECWVSFPCLTILALDGTP